MTGAAFRSGDLRVEYEERGTGFPLLALHGYYPDRRLMTGCLEPLFDEAGRAPVPPGAAHGRPEGGRTRRSYRRIYPDLPFMGASSDPDGIRDSDGMLDALCDFVRGVLPEGPFLAAGESYGGYLARGLARRFPDRVRGLLLLCPLIVAERKDRSVPALRALRVEPGYGAGRSPGEIAEFESVAVVRDRYCQERFSREILPGLALARGGRLEALRDAGFGYSFDGMGRAGTEGAGEPFDPVFPGPALFLLGRQDASVGWTDALRLADRYPRATFAVLDGSGHNLQIEAAGLFACHVGAWLAACEED